MPRMQPEAILPRGYGRGVRAGAGRAAARLRRAGWPAARHARARLRPASWQAGGRLRPGRRPSPSRDRGSRGRGSEPTSLWSVRSATAFARLPGSRDSRASRSMTTAAPVRCRERTAMEQPAGITICGKSKVGQPGGLPAGGVDQSGAVVGEGRPAGAPVSGSSRTKRSCRLASHAASSGGVSRSAPSP